MSLTDDLNTHVIPTDDALTAPRSATFKIVSVLAAIVITAALFIAYMIWRQKHEEIVGTDNRVVAEPVRVAPPTKVQVTMDQPIRKGSDAIVNGKVTNISDDTLTHLQVEVELSHRKDATTEPRSIDVEPGDLGPGATGRYSLVLSGDYRGIKLLQVRSGSPGQEIGYRRGDGAKRPPEKPPQGKTIIVEKPAPQGKGEEFINTPDNPARIP